MKTIKLLSTALGGVIIAATLAACGGGGGGGGSAAPSTGSDTPSNTDGSWLTFTPSNINLSVYEGESANFTVTATASKTFSQSFNVAIMDPVGVIVAKATSVQQNTPYQYAVTMQVDRSLTIGPHTTNLEVRLCQDDPTVCKSPFPGSPWHVPVSVTVKPGINLTSLHALPQVPAWSNTQGNAAHTAAVSASFNPANFSRRWDSKVPNLSSVAIDNGLIFGVALRSDGGNEKLVALSEQSGQEVWHADLGSVYALGPVTTNGKVIISTRSATSTDSTAYLMVFDQKTGAQIAKKAVARSGVPVVMGDAIYISSGFNLYKFSASTYEQLAVAYINYPFLPAPAADASYVYVQGDTLQVLNASDLSTAYTINYYTGSSPTVPVLTDRQVLYTSGGDNSTVYDLANRSGSRWRVTGTGISYANGTVYSIQNFNGLFKLNASDVKGGSGWSSDSLPVNLNFNSVSIVATDNVVFIGADSATFAIDLKTHLIVWTYPFGGELALSNNGVLYVLGKDGRLGAINLQ